MARSMRAALTGVAVAGLVALVAGTARAQDITVMTSVPGLNFPFFVHMLKAMQEEGKALGIKTVESDGQNSAPKQSSDVEAAVVQALAGIVISPIDVNAMAPSLQSAIDNGVPVVTIDRRVAGVNGITAHVGADNVKGGEAQGEWVLATFPNGANIVNLQGQPGASPAIDRNKGLHNVLDAHKDKYKFVAEQTANFKRDEGLSVAESLLAGMSTPPDVIVCANDDMALGAIEAVKARGMADKVKVIGFDALPEALAAVRDGALAGTVEQFPGGQSRKAMQIMVELLKDKKQPESDLVLLTPIIITKDNLDKAERLSELK